LAASVSNSTSVCAAIGVVDTGVVAIRISKCSS
jgi:hypothetical protein